MKSRNIKTRLAAFGLALLMGLSPLGNLADVHAAENEISQNAVTEKESKTESDHPVSEISEQTVTQRISPKMFPTRNLWQRPAWKGFSMIQKKRM